MCRKKRLILKSIAATLCIVFVSSELRAAPMESPQNLTAQEAMLSHPQLFEAPIDFASLSDLHAGQNGKFIIHIQDAHSNFSAQDNLASAMRDLMTKYDIKLVLSEGGYGDCTLSDLRDKAKPELVKRVARSFLHSGEIHGEEYLNLTDKRPMKIIGIEDKALYEEGLKYYEELADKREKVLGYLVKSRNAIEKLKTKLYPKELVDYERAGLARQNTDWNVEEFLKLAAKQNLDLSKYSELVKLSDIKRSEQAIDFESANLEQSVLIEELFKKGAKETLESYLAKMKQMKGQSSGGKVAQFAYFEKTLSIAKEKGVETSRFPNFLAYVDYLQKFSALNFDVLLHEFDRAEDDLYKKVLSDYRLQTRDQRLESLQSPVSSLQSENDDAFLLRAVDRFILLLQTAHQIQMTADQFALFKYNEPDFSTEAMQAFLNRKLAEQGYFEDIIPYEPLLEDARKTLDKFYDSVKRRDMVFMENIEKAMGVRSQESGVRSEQNIAFLIAGGYHTPHLKELLRDEGYGYAVLTPIVTTETNQKKYESLLLNKNEQPKKKVHVVSGESRAADKSLGALDDDLAKLIKKKDKMRTAMAAVNWAVESRLAAELGVTNWATKSQGHTTTSDQAPVTSKNLRTTNLPVRQAGSQLPTQSGARLAKVDDVVLYQGNPYKVVGKRDKNTPENDADVDQYQLRPLWKDGGYGEGVDWRYDVPGLIEVLSEDRIRELEAAREQKIKPHAFTAPPNNTTLEADSKNLEDSIRNQVNEVYKRIGRRFVWGQDSTQDLKKVANILVWLDIPDNPADIFLNIQEETVWQTNGWEPIIDKLMRIDGKTFEQLQQTMDRNTVLKINEILFTEKVSEKKFWSAMTENISSVSGTWVNTFLEFGESAIQWIRMPNAAMVEPDSDFDIADFLQLINIITKIANTPDSAEFREVKRERNVVRALHLITFGTNPRIDSISVLFHGTKADNLERIIFEASGQIDARQSEDKVGRGENYFSFDRDVSERFAIGWAGIVFDERKRGMVLEFDVAQLLHLGIKFELGPSISEKEYITRKTIPLSALTMASKRAVSERFWSDNGKKNDQLAEALGYNSAAEMVNALAGARLADGDSVAEKRGKREAGRGDTDLILGSRLSSNLSPPSSPLGSGARLTQNEERGERKEVRENTDPIFSSSPSSSLLPLTSSLESGARLAETLADSDVASELRDENIEKEIFSYKTFADISEPALRVLVARNPENSLYARVLIFSETRGKYDYVGGASVRFDGERMYEPSTSVTRGFAYMEKAIKLMLKRGVIERWSQDYAGGSEYALRMYQRFGLDPDFNVDDGEVTLANSSSGQSGARLSANGRSLAAKALGGFDVAEQEDLVKRRDQIERRIGDLEQSIIRLNDLVTKRSEEADNMSYVPNPSYRNRIDDAVKELRGVKVALTKARGELTNVIRLLGARLAEKSDPFRSAYLRVGEMVEYQKGPKEPSGTYFVTETGKEAYGVEMVGIGLAVNKTDYRVKAGNVSRVNALTEEEYLSSAVLALKDASLSEVKHLDAIARIAELVTNHRGDEDKLWLLKNALTESTNSLSKAQVARQTIAMNHISEINKFWSAVRSAVIPALEGARDSAKTAETKKAASDVIISITGLSPGSLRAKKSGARLAEYRKDLTRREDVHKIMQIVLDFKEFGIRVSSLLDELSKFRFDSAGKETLKALKVKLDQYLPLTGLRRLNLGDRIVTFNQRDMKTLNTRLGILSNDRVMDYRRRTLLDLMKAQGLVTDADVLTSGFAKQDKFILRGDVVNRLGEAQLQEIIKNIAVELSDAMNRHLSDEEFAGRVGNFEFIAYPGISQALSANSDEDRMSVDYQALVAAKISRRREEQGSDFLPAVFKMDEFMGLTERAADIKRQLGEIPSEEEMFSLRGLNEAEVVKLGDPRKLNIKLYLDLIDLFDYPKAWMQAGREYANLADEIQRISARFQGVIDGAESVEDSGAAAGTLANDINKAQAILKTSLKDPELTDVSAFHFSAAPKDGFIVSMDVYQFYKLAVSQAAWAHSQFIDSDRKDPLTAFLFAAMADDRIKGTITQKRRDLEVALKEAGLETSKMVLDDGRRLAVGLREGGDEIVLKVHGRLDPKAIPALAASIKDRVTIYRMQDNRAYAAAFTDIAGSHGQHYTFSQTLDNRIKELAKTNGIPEAGVMYADPSLPEPDRLKFYYASRDGSAGELSLPWAGARLAIRPYNKINDQNTAADIIRELNPDLPNKLLSHARPSSSINMAPPDRYTGLQTHLLQIGQTKPMDRPMRVMVIGPGSAEGESFAMQETIGSLRRPVEYTVIDYDEQVLNAALHPNWNKIPNGKSLSHSTTIDFVRSFAEDIDDYGQGLFSVIIATNSLFYAMNKDRNDMEANFRFMGRFIRALEPGGRLILGKWEFMLLLPEGEERAQFNVAWTAWDQDAVRTGLERVKSEMERAGIMGADSLVFQPLFTGDGLVEISGPDGSAGAREALASYGARLAIMHDPLAGLIERHEVRLIYNTGPLKVYQSISDPKVFYKRSPSPTAIALETENLRAIRPLNVLLTHSMPEVIDSGEYREEDILDESWHTWYWMQIRMPAVTHEFSRESWAGINTYAGKLRFVLSLASYLKELHEAGWIHGDVKPQNFVIDGTNKGYMIDFEHAKPVDSDLDMLSRASSRALRPRFFETDEGVHEWRVTGLKAKPYLDIVAFGVSLKQIFQSDAVKGLGLTEIIQKMTLGLNAAGDVDPEQINDMSEVIEALKMALSKLESSTLTESGLPPINKYRPNSLDENASYFGGDESGARLAESETADQRQQTADSTAASSPVSRLQSPVSSENQRSLFLNGARLSSLKNPAVDDTSRKLLASGLLRIRRAMGVMVFYIAIAGGSALAAVGPAGFTIDGQALDLSSYASQVLATPSVGETRDILAEFELNDHIQSERQAIGLARSLVAANLTEYNSQKTVEWRIITPDELSDAERSVYLNMASDAEKLLGGGKIILRFGTPTSAPFVPLAGSDDKGAHAIVYYSSLSEAVLRMAAGAGIALTEKTSGSERAHLSPSQIILTTVIQRSTGTGATDFLSRLWAVVRANPGALLDTASLALLQSVKEDAQISSYENLTMRAVKVSWAKFVSAYEMLRAVTSAA